MTAHQNLQGDPTFLYGGYGYRPPSFGYAWAGAQTTSFAQLPTDAGSSKTVLSPKSLSKCVPQCTTNGCDGVVERPGPWGVVQ